MPVPTILTLSASSGPTRGRRIVKITGTNFEMRPSPPPLGRTLGTLKESVEVLFGSVRALEVMVMHAGLLHVVTPPHDPGTFDLTIRNVDQDGVLVPGETATLANAYTFQRPDFNRTGSEETVLARVVRTLIREIKRQLIENVVIAVHTDYDNTIDAANVAMLPKTPGLVLSGPRLRDARDYATNEDREEERDSSVYQKRPARTVDVEFTVIGVHDSSQPMQNFLQETIGFFDGNKELLVLADPTVAGDYVGFELDITDQFGVTGSPNNSNIRVFQGEVTIRGVELDDVDMAAREIYIVNEVAPTGSIMETLGVIFTGLPGTTTTPPVQANPPAVVGNTGSFEQIPPEE